MPLTSNDISEMLAEFCTYNLLPASSHFSSNLTENTAYIGGPVLDFPVDDDSEFSLPSPSDPCLMQNPISDAPNMYTTSDLTNNVICIDSSIEKDNLVIVTSLYSHVLLYFILIYIYLM